MGRSPGPHGGSQPSCKDSDGVGVAFKSIASNKLKIEALKLRKRVSSGLCTKVNK